VTVKPVSLALCLLLALGAHAQPRWPEVDAALQPLVDDGALSGAATLIVKDGRLVHASTIGARDIAAGRRNKGDRFIFIPYEFR
jgi:hypothetical protein